MTSDSHTALLNEARYAERLCQRTARLYRRVQVVGTFATVVSGSAALSVVAGTFPAWFGLVGAGAFAAFGAAMLAIRPAEKVAANEADVKRYAKLRSEASGMDEAQLRTALNKARESDAPEVEPLRDVAFNDVSLEIGRGDVVVPLTLPQKVLAALA